MLPNYYVGTTLSDIGRNMQADRDTQARQEMAQAEQQRLAQAALMQHLYQQQAQQQQNQQFQQELALRQSAQDQQVQHQNDLLGLQKQQMDFSQNGYNPVQQWQQNFNEQELAARERMAKMQADAGNPRVAEERFKQGAITDRENALALENWQAEQSAAQAKAAEYNALAQQIDTEAERLKGTGKEWFTSQSTADEKARQQLMKHQELITALRADTRPGMISPDASGKRFVPVTRPRPVGANYSFGASPGGFNPTARFDGDAMGQQQAGIPAPVAGARVSPVSNQPIRIQGSDGKQLTIRSSDFAEVKRLDPGVQIISASAPSGTPSRSPIAANPAIQQQTGPYFNNRLMDALYRRGAGAVSNIYGQAIDNVGGAVNQVMTPAEQQAQAYYNQLINGINGGGQWSNEQP